MTANYKFIGSLYALYCGAVCNAINNVSSDICVPDQKSAHWLPYFKCTTIENLGEFVDEYPVMMIVIWCL